MSKMGKSINWVHGIRHGKHVDSRSERLVRAHLDYYNIDKRKINKRSSLRVSNGIFWMFLICFSLFFFSCTGHSTQKKELENVTTSFHFEEKNVVLKYDDGRLERASSPWGDQASGQLGVIFSPNLYPATLSKVFFFIADLGIPTVSFRVRIYRGSPSKGPEAEDLLEDNIVVSASYGNKWVEVDLSDYNIVITSGSLCVSMEWLIAPGRNGQKAQFLGVDTSNPTRRSWWKFNSNKPWTRIEKIGGYGDRNLMIRAYFEKEKIGKPTPPKKKSSELAEEKKISKEDKLAAELETTPVKKAPDSDSVEGKKEIFSDPIGFGTYYGLVIGNNAYKHLPGLKTAERDAQRVADVLQHLYDFKVKVLLNGTRRNIIKALDKYRKELTTKDNLLIYYAGHGYFDKSANRGYWLPVEAEKETTADWISNADITDKLKAYRAKHVIVVADSCYSGALTRGLNIQVRETGYLKRIAKKRSRTVLTSGGNEPVRDGGGEGHSVFARSFINALEENTGVMDATELYLKIRRPVILNAPQTPQYSDIRFAGHDGGDFIFIRRR